MCSNQVNIIRIAHAINPCFISDTLQRLTLFGRFQNQEDDDESVQDDSPLFSAEFQFSALHNKFTEVSFRFHVNVNERS